MTGSFAAVDLDRKHDKSRDVRMALKYGNS